MIEAREYGIVQRFITVLPADSSLDDATARYREIRQEVKKIMPVSSVTDDNISMVENNEKLEQKLRPYAVDLESVLAEIRKNTAGLLEASRWVCETLGPARHRMFGNFTMVDLDEINAIDFGVNAGSRARRAK